jgi:uncharacterized protein
MLGDLEKLKSFKNVVIYLAGCFLFSCGVKLLLISDLGIDPYHSMIVGIVDQIDNQMFKIGAVSGFITVSVLIVWSLATKNRILLSPFLTMFLVGIGIDVLNWFQVESLLYMTAPAVALLITGLVFDAYASALIIASGFGIRVMDLVALSMARGPVRSFTIAKFSLEVCFVLVALIAGGPVGIATVLFVFVVALLIEPFMLMNRAIFGLDLHNDLQRLQA